MISLQRIIGLSVIAASFVVGWWWMAYQQFLDRPIGLPEAGVVYQLKPGTSIQSLANDFENRGWIDRSIFMRLLARLEGPFAIKAGEFQLRHPTTPVQLLQQLQTGKVILHQQIILEGWNFRDLMAAVRANSVLEQTLPDDLPETVITALGLRLPHPEGLFFPDTYNFPRGTTDVQFLRRAYQRMESALLQAWQERADNLPLKDSYQALILASIVEKETGKSAERAQIAGVFSRRLKKGMKLQTDPTVIYGMGTRFKGNIRRKDLREDTPYNTYVHTGLPPTPICMPSLAAIEAVLHPAAGKDLYFVAKGDGSHQFSATLKDHNRAVRRYQLKK